MMKSTSQSASFTAEGTLDRDISNVLTTITPDKTPLMSMLHVGPKATEMAVEWHTDDLNPAQKNQQLEVDEYTFDKAGGVWTDKNYVQIFRKGGQVSDVMQIIKTTYNNGGNELNRQKLIKMKEIAKDMEYAIMVNSNAYTGSGTVAPMMGGIPYFMAEKNIDVVIHTDGDSNANLITCTKPHGLVTGNFVVFKENGETLPAEIELNQRYYIRQSKVSGREGFDFYLYNELEDAVEDKKKIVFTDPSAGTTVDAKIMLNNVISAEDHLFTEEHISDAMELAMYRGGNPTHIVMSPANKKRFSSILNQVHTTNRDQSNTKVEDVVTIYESDFGTVTAMSHLDCTNNNMYLLDLDYWMLRYLDTPHIISEKELSKTGSYEKFVITGAFTLQGTQPLSSACITDIKRPPKSGRGA